MDARALTRRDRFWRRLDQCDVAGPHANPWPSACRISIQPRFIFTIICRCCATGQAVQFSELSCGDSIGATALALSARMSSYW